MVGEELDGLLLEGADCRVEVRPSQAQVDDARPGQVAGHVNSGISRHTRIWSPLTRARLGLTHDSGGVRAGSVPLAVDSSRSPRSSSSARRSE